MVKVKRQYLISLLLAGLVPCPSPVEAGQKVSIELVLATDTSISVDAAEYQLQMSGIAEAFRDLEIIDTILDLPDGVAVTLVHWSTGHLNRIAVDWQYLASEPAILAFARSVENAARSATGRSTAIGDAIDFSRRQIESNLFDGQIAKIDISGDERSNSGPRPSQARDRAVASGLTVNGLAILGRDSGLYDYFRSYVVGGPSAFVISVDGFEDFREAIRQKLKRELSNSANIMPKVHNVGPKME